MNPTTLCVFRNDFANHRLKDHVTPIKSPRAFVMLLSILFTLAAVLLSLSFVYIDTNSVRGQKQLEQQQQPLELTSQGSPIAIIPALTQNVLTIVSFLIGTSSFILGLRIQNAARTTTESRPSSTTATTTTTKPTIPSSIINNYFEILILALVIPAVIIIIYGILLVGSHLYPGDAPYLLLLFALFIPSGTVLFLVRKLRSKSSN